MPYLRLVLFAAVMAQCFAPAAAQTVQFATAEVLRVSVVSGDGQPRSWQLEPASSAHAKLIAWLSGNQSGWTRYVATLPGKGVLVDGISGRVQFSGRSAFVCPGGSECLHKTVQPSDYEYLLQSRPR